MFPTNPEEFDADDRISFSKISNTFILETEDGREFQWDQGLKRWFEDLDDDEIARQQQAYAVAGVDESEPVANPRKKRKPARDDDPEDGRKSPNSAKRQRKPETGPKERKNTAVYATNLPADTTVEEVQQVFSKCGMIAEEIDSGRPRIKLYEDSMGQFKGDVLVVYFRPESVQLAIQMLDDTDFRFGQNARAGRMKVVEADRTYKRQNNDSGGGQSNGNGNGSEKASQQQQQQRSSRDKQKIIARTQKLNARLADWSDEDDDPSTLSGGSSRWDKVVVLKHMFTLEELKEDPGALLDIKADIRDECAKLGDVTNVVLYDGEPDGVCSVRFADPAAARACVDVMHGRWFARTQVEAYISKGERFRKNNADKRDADEDDDEEGEGNGNIESAVREKDAKSTKKSVQWLQESNAEAQVDVEDGSRREEEKRKAEVDPERQ